MAPHPWNCAGPLPQGVEPQAPRARASFGAMVVAEGGAAAFVREAESAGPAAAAAAINCAGGLLVIRGLSEVTGDATLMARWAALMAPPLRHIRSHRRSTAFTSNR